MNQICMVHSQILLYENTKWRMRGDCMMEISVCWCFESVAEALGGLFASYWEQGLFFAQMRGCCDCLEESTHVVLSCGSPWWVFPGFSWLFQTAVSHCEICTNHMKGYEHQKSVCDLIWCVCKLHISWFAAGLSLFLSAGAALQSIGVMREEWRLCWTQVEMQLKSAQWWRSCLKCHNIILGTAVGELYRWSS